MAGRYSASGGLTCPGTLFFLLGSLWIHNLTHACRAEEDQSRGLLLAWVRNRVLDGLGLQKPPQIRRGDDGVVARPQARPLHWRGPRLRRNVGARSEEGSELILFPSLDSTCVRSNSTSGPASSHLTFRFQPSVNKRHLAVTAAHFWFRAGDGANSSSLLFILTGAQSLQAAEAPSEFGTDGWATYHLDLQTLAPVTRGPVELQVRCVGCKCQNGEKDKLPFLHLKVHPHGPVRSPRHAAATIPWSPSAVHLLQRPSPEQPQHGDCHRATVDISLRELGWDNWIVHPEVLTFSYCHGNCSAEDRAAALLGVTQCCAPVPGTMKSLRVTTTSDGGYSFRHETLPNIIPEECACF